MQCHDVDSTLSKLRACWVVLNASFVLSLFVPHLSFFWFPGQAVLRYCGISWVYSPIFFYIPALSWIMVDFLIFPLLGFSPADKLSSCCFYLDMFRYLDTDILPISPLLALSPFVSLCLSFYIFRPLLVHYLVSWVLFFHHRGFLFVMLLAKDLLGCASHSKLKICNYLNNPKYWDRQAWAV